MNRVGKLILTWVGWQPFVVGSVLSLAVISVALGLSSLVRGLESGLTLLVAFLALAVGWILSAVPLGPVISMGLLTLGGLAVLIIRLGNLGGKIFILIWAVLQPISKSDTWLFMGLPEWSLIRETAGGLAADISTVITRISAWITGAAQGNPVFDPLVPAFLWGMAIWLVFAWAGWAVRRGYPGLRILLPGLILMGAAFGYTGGNPISLVALLAAILFLSILMDQVYRERRWQAAGTDFALEIRFDLAATAGSLSVLLISLSMVVPVIQPRAIAETIQNFTPVRQPSAETFVRSIGLEPRPAQASALKPYYTPGLPRQHLIGSGPELSTRTVMTVAVEDLSNLPAPANPDKQPTLYWRSFTYDRYTGRGWATSPTTAASYQPGTPVLKGDPNRYRRIRETVRGVEDLNGLLFAAGDILTVDHAFTLERRSDDDIFAGSVNSGTYAVEASIVDIRPETLSRAGQDFPDWIKNRYLHLPENVPARVLGLARDLTSTAATPYDRARAIEAYLRKFPYTLDLPAPPANQDLADYFLFQLQKGYCDYYATAMVVLARAVGLPARLATGYATGIYHPDSGAFTVTEADAHSWPEIYFPGTGWVAFEPTASRSSSVEPGAFAPMQPPLPTPGGPQSAPQPGVISPNRQVWLLLAAAAAAALAILGWTVLKGRRRGEAAPQQVLERWYRTLCRDSSRLGIPIRRSDTPLEVSQKLTGHIEQVSAQARWMGFLGPATAEIQSLVNDYILSAYASKAASPGEFARLRSQWPILRMRLWLAWISSSLNRSRERR